MSPQAWSNAGWAVAVAVAAVGLAAVLPVAKRLWTTPFAFGAAAFAVLVLTLVHAALADRGPDPSARRVRDHLSAPLIALGRNSLLVYFGSHLLQDQLTRRGWALPWSEAIAVLGHPRLTWVVVSVAVWTALAVLLDRRRIYLRP